MIMKYKKIILPIVGIVIALSVILSSIQLYIVNQRFPNANTISHTLNEMINGGNTSLIVMDSQLLDGVQINQLYPEYVDSVLNPDGTQVRPEQIKVLLIHAKLINNTEETQKMTLVQMYAESLIWYNGIDGGLYPLFNPDNPNPIEVTLEPNQEIEVSIPYTMYDFQFQQQDWIDIRSRKFDLCLSFYPDRHIISL